MTRGDGHAFRQVLELLVDDGGGGGHQDTRSPLAIERVHPFGEAAAALLLVTGGFAGGETFEMGDQGLPVGYAVGADLTGDAGSQDLLGPAAADAQQTLERGAVDPAVGQGAKGPRLPPPNDRSRSVYPAFVYENEHTISDGGFARLRNMPVFLTSEKQEFSEASDFGYAKRMENGVEVIAAPDAVELMRLANETGGFLAAAKAESTRRAYRADWNHFEAWCRRHALAPLPATPQTVAFCPLPTWPPAISRPLSAAALP